MNEKELMKEFEGVSAALKNVGFTDATIAYRQKFWREYYIFHGDLQITEQSLNDFLKRAYEIEPHNVNITKRQYDVRASLRNLLEYKTYGRIINCHTAWYMNMPWPEKFKLVVDEFLEQQKEKGNKPQTILQHARTLKRFAVYLSKIGVDSFTDLKPSHISSFFVDSINEMVQNLSTYLCNLRVFFRFLYLNGYNEEDLSLVIPKSNVLIKRKHIPTTFTRDDINKIIACIDLASPVGKRDYAIIMLVARTGIRTSDVVGLKFENIKWDKNCIQLIQYKTNEPLVLPLFEDVGNAIIDYIRNGRPASDLEYVFITHKPPFQQFSKNNHLHTMFNKYLVKSGIQITPEKNHGLHTLRHSLATELMRKNTPVPVIAEILGHKSIETTMKYLRSDTEELRYCTLIEGENYAAKA